MFHDTPPTAELASSDDHHGGGRYVRYAHPSADERAALIAELAEGYLAGADVRELSAATGCSFGFTRKLLHEGGVEMRPRTSRPKRRDQTAAGAPGAPAADGEVAI